MDLIRNCINFPIKENIERHHLENLIRCSSVEECKHLFFLGLNLFTVFWGFFVWLLLLLFCHLYSEKFSWKHLSAQTSNGTVSCSSSCLGFWKLAVQLVERWVWDFACHKLSSQNSSQKILCYSKSHCWCFMSAWMMVKDRYQLNHFVICLFENFPEWSHGKWFAPLNTKLVASSISI